MKKKAILSIIMLMMSMMSFANGEQDFTGGQLELEVGYIKEMPIGTSMPRTPEIIPTIYFDGTILYFATSCDGCALQIVDAAENICYEVVIPMGTTELELPNNLFGEYELRIIHGNTLYYGEINITNI
ncbi:MAG: hypothetical protein J6A02_11555 [Prevotella sp.]|nr:hypothetical protein [Prevotella sp.]